MPIPTRSASLREPRKPTSNVASPATNTTSTRNPPSSRPTNDSTRPSSKPSPVEGFAKDNGASNQGRTLLPQRNSNLSRDNGNGLGRMRIQPPDSKLPQRGETSPRGEPQAAIGGDKQDSATTITKASAPTRRQSLMRPSTSRVVSTTKPNASSAKAAPPTFRPPSPRKAPLRSPTQPTSTPRPPSPKKTDMPPPQRPMRSASLRQPPGAGSGPPAAVRGHARHRSQMVPSSAKPIQPDSTPAAQKSRPQFTSYQQHYSPKKPTKPPTPTPGAGPEPGSLLIPRPDIAALQTELLQLSLFHSSSLQKHSDWKNESETRLRHKYDGVAAQYRSMLGDEKMRQSQVNAKALDCWLQSCHDHRGPHDFSEQIQILSQILQEISDLVTSGMGGRYSQAVDAFELWFEQAELVRHDRKYPGDGISFVDSLDKAWKEELNALYAKLELCQRQLQSLDILGFGEVERLEQSALTRVTKGLAESIHLMLQEISVMRTLEAELVRSEREAVSQLVERLSIPREMSAPRVGIWSQT